ncbi:MAG: hypothetical protein IPI10_13875 [Bacteroidetes bacterium]|nr:hypothetical protein [Bacteroidota bacterium]
MEITIPAIIYWLIQISKVFDSIYYGGGVNGPNVDIVLRDSNNDFVIAVGTFFGGGGYSTGGQKINYPSTNSWLATGGGNHAINGMALDKSNRLFLASFNWVAAASASLLLFDTAGVLSNTFLLQTPLMEGL